MTSVLDLGVRVESIAEVERQLAQLRRSTSARAREGVALPARAAVLTLVVYATRRVHAERAARTIAVLADRHPSRALILFHDAGATSALTLRCHLPRAAGNQVLYEQIVVRAREEVPHLLRSLAIPLTIADLPVFLWWTGTPHIHAPHFDELLALAHRLVIDSADFARPDEALPELERLAREGNGRFGVTDLNWTRLTAWRELVAQFFDVREWRGFLDRIAGVRISFAVDMDGREIHPSQALLLVGWLAALLGWRPLEQLAPSEAGGLLFRVARAEPASRRPPSEGSGGSGIRDDGRSPRNPGPGAPIWVRVRPRFVRGIDEGNVTGVRLRCEGDGREAEFVIKRSEDGRPHAETEVLVDGASVMRRTVFLPMPSVVELLGEELTITRSDAVYEEALRSLCELGAARA